MPDQRVRPAIVELTLVRLREFVREPEAMFWVFGFPFLRLHYRIRTKTG